ncbi:MAG TPA: hypothetical protein VFW98_14475 [Gemmatimonadaceae bacterium]|nr:hypothetical protein [Gemmatimonadaceae bacterium]
MRYGRLSPVLMLSVAAALALAAPAVMAQHAPDSAAVARGAPQNAQSQPGRVHEVVGRVVRPTPNGHGTRPVPEQWVVIHRVGSDTAGPLDSTRTESNGGFRLHYRPWGDSNAIYFMSASYDGIAYFSEPLHGTRVTGPAAEITVYDTTSAPVPLNVRGRHIVIASPRADGTREMMEVYELANDSSVTRISPDDAHPTWTTILPSDATEFQVGQTEISPRAMHYADGKLAVVAPFAPGLKQLSFSVRLSADDFPLSIPIEDSASVLEVLLEEPTATVTGAQLAQAANVAVEGRTFTRYLAEHVPANTVIRISVPRVTPAQKPIYFAVIAILIGAAMLVALAVAFRRRVAPARAVSAPAVALSDDADQVARAIAMLDESFARRSAPTSEDRTVYEHTREALKRRLAAALEAQRHAG